MPSKTSTALSYSTHKICTSDSGGSGDELPSALASSSPGSTGPRPPIDTGVCPPPGSVRFGALDWLPIYRQKLKYPPQLLHPVRKRTEVTDV